MAGAISRLETTRPSPAVGRKTPWRRPVTDVARGLPLPPGMVDAIIRLTVLAVLALAAANALHAATVFVRFARQIARRAPHGGLSFWLPAFGSMRDARIWVGRWRALLASHDPALVALRLDARLVITRHLHLTLLSHTWAIALSALAPRLV